MQYSAIAIFTHFTVHRYTGTRLLSLHWSYPGNVFIIVSLSLQIIHDVLFHRLIPFLQTANFDDSTQFNSSAPKLMSWQVGISKLD
jgi:hypothetical protein